MTDNATTKEVGFYNQHSGLKGRDGGPYLDQVNRQYAEVNRAQQEGREPLPLDGSGGALPAEAGTPLLPVSQLIDNSITSNPSMANVPLVSDEQEKHLNIKPVVVADLDTRTQADLDAEEANSNKPATKSFDVSPTTSGNVTTGATTQPVAKKP